MSTRCNIHFTDEPGGEVLANIYLHCDGYPVGSTGLPARFMRFSAILASVHPPLLVPERVAWRPSALRADAANDLLPSLRTPYHPAQRFSDPQLLAAKFLVFLAGERPCDPDRQEKHYLDFRSVYIATEDATDIRYRYEVSSPDRDLGGIPRMRYQEAGSGEWVNVLWSEVSFAEDRAPEHEEEEL